MAIARTALAGATAAAVLLATPGFATEQADQTGPSAGTSTSEPAADPSAEATNDSSSQATTTTDEGCAAPAPGSGPTPDPDQGTAQQAMYDHWVEHENDEPLGNTCEEQPSAVADGYQWTFANGVLFWSEGTPARDVRGPILTRYQWLGGPAGRLGFPTADTGPYGHVQSFEHGRIYWSSATGAREVLGPILGRYLRLGGRKALGYPVRGEIAAAGVAGARQSWFERGRIYWSSATGAREVRGAIMGRYLRLGGPSGRLGLPTTGIIDAAGADTARQARFQRGRIYWSRGTGAHEVRGAILGRYTRMRAAGGPLGLPVTNELRASGARGAKQNVFQRGRIYSSSRTGAHSVRRPFMHRFSGLGYAGGRLGLPTSQPYRVNGGWRQRFQDGHLLWDRSRRRTYFRLPYFARAQRITARDVPYTWRSGCPVGPGQLRMVRIVHRGWNGDDRVGRLVVRGFVVDEMRRVFGRAHRSGFPIRRMIPVDRWRGSDVRAMEADNTSAFNCRHVTGNPYRLSQHSYGNAIDINTVENPYVTSSRVYPEGSGTYLNRGWVRKGMIISGDAIAGSLRREGWLWGARWANPDYQHFSSNGG